MGRIPDWPYLDRAFDFWIFWPSQCQSHVEEITIFPEHDGYHQKHGKLHFLLPQEDGRGSFRSKYTSHRWLLCYCWRVGTRMSGQIWQILFYVLSQSPHFLAHDRKNLHVGITELPVHLLNWKAGSNTARPCKFKTNVWAIKQQWPSKIIIPNMVDMLATKLDLPISEDSQHWTHVAWVHGLEHVTEPLRYQKKHDNR